MPVNVTLKNKILSFFCKSKLAANRFPQTLQVVSQSIYGTQTNIKVRIFVFRITLIVGLISFLASSECDDFSWMDFKSGREVALIGSNSYIIYF